MALVGNASSLQKSSGIVAGYVGGSSPCMVTETTLTELRLWRLVRGRDRSKALAYEYSFPAVSNMLSSWCQYEALKYVTFPTQARLSQTCQAVFSGEGGTGAG